MAASPDLHSVTSILFWDGPDRVVGEYDFSGPDNWQEGICECCYAQPFNQVRIYFQRDVKHHRILGVESSHVNHFASNDV